MSKDMFIAGEPAPTLPPDPESPAFVMAVGDLASTAKGSGARANGGKVPLELIPFEVLSCTTKLPAVTATLAALGAFQSRREPWVFRAIRIAVEAAGGWDSCARVFDYGRRKYAAWNWSKGMPWSVPLACAGRHLLAIDRGEADDPESGLPHWGHVLCNLVMLATYVDTYPEGDDRPPAGMLAPVPA